MIFSFFKSNLFFKDKTIVTNLILSLVLWLFGFIWLYSQIQPRVEPIALRYTIYFGIDLIGPWWHIYIITLIGLIIFLSNFILAYFIYLNTKILAYLFVLASSAIQALLVIMSILIVLLNK